jgi:hypothetical protein
LVQLPSCHVGNDSTDLSTGWPLSSINLVPVGDARPPTAASILTLVANNTVRSRFSDVTWQLMVLRQYQSLQTTDAPGCYMMSSIHAAKALGIINWL